jgi:P-type E1-E2 ATPase
VEAELTPEQKIRIVQSEKHAGMVMMIGDGINDAPALAAADIGLAMGVHGSAGAAEAADAVLLVERLDRVLEGMLISRGCRRIALQSVFAGIGLSVIGMVVAAAGGLAPVQGALLQEAIDVAVIINALRALRIRPVIPS